VDGQVFGHVLAGVDLAVLTAGGKLLNQLTPQVSVSGRVGAGTGTAGITNVSFNAGGTKFFTGFTPTPGADGGDIDHVSLRYGVGPRGIVAGDGDSPLTGAGGHGGSITAVTVARSPYSLHVFAGNGGGSTINGDAGDGGSIRDSSFSVIATAGEVQVFAGAGGSAARDGSGHGGSMANVKLSVASSLSRVQVVGGDAGLAVMDGQAVGKGGDLSDLQVVAKSVTDSESFSPALIVRAGDGASTGADGSESTGGTISHLRLSAGDATGSANGLVRAGNGGASGDRFHGTGGAILDSTLALNGHFTSFEILGGAGGGQILAGAGGGRIDHVRFTNAVDQGGVSISGGDTIEAPAGAVTNLDATNFAGRLDFLSIRGGSALIDAMTADPLGLLVGGAISDLSLTNDGTTIKSLVVTGGTGTIGGALSDLRIENNGRLPFATLTGGTGRFGGGVDHVTVKDTAGIGALSHPLRIDAGSALQVPTNGATAADISDLQINAPLGYVAIGGGAVAGAGGSVGGPGGNVMHVFGTAKWLDLRASDGGRAGGGTGGTGGNISDVRFTVTGVFVYRGAAGNGGEGQVGGIGGSVSDVFINGDIGDFHRAFGFERSFGQMGGLSAGKAGRSFNNTPVAAGSVADISANRIAAIVAGSPSADQPLTATNAVASISNISAKVLGADTGLRGEHKEIVNRRHSFDFKGGGDDVFTLGQDTPVDGLVVVRAGGVLTPLPVAPLKLVVV
jgi:hypothetical protein